MTSGEFNTESSYDFLTIKSNFSLNGIQFSGAVGPGARYFDSNFEITWASDGSITRSWVGGLFRGGYCTAVSSSAAGVQLSTERQLLGVQLSTGGQLLDKWQFPWQVRGQRVCAIRGPAGTRMVTESFATEFGYDVLMVNANRFDGAVGPGTMEFVDNFEIIWASEDNFEMTSVKDGWKVCFEVFQQRLESNCHQKGNCFTSGNFPGKYGNGERCSIQGPGGTRMVTESFNTESRYDLLTVKSNLKEVQSSGAVGPGARHFDSSFVINWTSDGSVTRSGWVVCFETMLESS